MCVKNEYLCNQKGIFILNILNYHYYLFSKHLWTLTGLYNKWEINIVSNLRSYKDGAFYHDLRCCVDFRSS